MATEPPAQPHGRLELADFEPLVGSVFEIRRSLHGEALDLKATLNRASASRFPRARERFRHPFELLFELEPEVQIPQLSCVLFHVELGEFDAFLVPMQPEPGGAGLLLATFN